MTKAELASQALKLPEAERLALAQDLWASIRDPNAYPEILSVPQWQKDLLDQRLEESKDDPGRPWPEVRAEIWPSGS